MAGYYEGSNDPRNRILLVQQPPAQTYYNQAAQNMPIQGSAVPKQEDAFYAQNPGQVQEPAITVFEQPRGLADTVPSANALTIQGGYANISHQLTLFKWKFPNFYQMPGLAFLDAGMHRHRDILQREYQGPEEDRYISPWDGHLAKLVVQAAQDVYDGPRNSTWRRTFVRNVSPIYIHVANYPFSSVQMNDTLWTNEDWAMIALKWLPACVGLLFVIWVNPAGADGAFRNHGKFDPFPYRHWLYPDIARNKFENSESALARVVGPEMERILGPRELCFLSKSGENDGFAIPRRVEAYEQDTQYVLVGYTAEQFSHDSEEDMEALAFIADRAAREAGVPAYWVASSCMSDPDELVNDVYRISDVMRGAHSLVIAIGPSRTRTMDNVNSQEEMLRIWGERMWTLPEALLCSNEQIKVYTRGRDNVPAWSISKKHFAATVWDDPLVSRQLVDHFLNNLSLSRLELVTIALDCLTRRKTHRKFPGDVSYALMGLVRRRPVVEPRDSEFIAFARLSLVNDNDCLLERLVCTQPKKPLGEWDDMEDAWDAKLWDIIPHCQVAGIGPGDTVILDGAYGAAIRWKGFKTVAFLERTSVRRILAQWAIHGAPVWLGTGITLLSFSSLIPALAGIGGIILAFALVVILTSPYLVRLLYIGKMWGAQPWLFGFEGYMDLQTIESHIFGSNMSRLKWSPAGSPISRHVQNVYGECVGIDPTKDPGVKAMVDQAKTSRFGELKVFTLVDTGSMTVTMFRAVRPPIAVLICGEEGGMQRAVMASYDWKNQTLFREAVVRMETTALLSLHRVNRFRFGFKRRVDEVREVQEV
ncbi:hypothetical protein Egran_04114 [Elaphomyces granulatus]|uniref:Heterokaryon incompatibility domain-containing protein n=1 Tax=Elaphomyces granulatus TaxID=519963 RepID=A0A232LVM8_9EURO|nr:hypothetical protein Egran_04114 [Elaphomyces granulatus]